MDIDHLKQWVGRTESAHDITRRAPLAGLAALLDRDGAARDMDAVPLLGHWLYFLPAARQSDIGEDGHPRRGSFLPPVALPRRMWAGGRLRFHHPVAIDAAIERRSTIEDVQAKSGTSGDMVFVTVRHDVIVEGRIAVEERQDIVFRGPADGSAPAPRPAEPRAAEMSESWSPDAVALFRYSALTFNAHRIHYDRDYARHVEGYPGLVVHGPLSATLLVDLFQRHHPDARVTAFDFRARAPLFDGAPMTLNLARARDGFDLWAAGPDGTPAMTATIKAEG